MYDILRTSPQICLKHLTGFRDANGLILRHARTLANVSQRLHDEKGIRQATQIASAYLLNKLDVLLGSGIAQLCVQPSRWRPAVNVSLVVD